MSWDTYFQDFKCNDVLRVACMSRPRIERADYCGKFLADFLSYEKKTLFFDLGIFMDMFNNIYSPCGYSYATHPLSIIEKAGQGLCKVTTTISQVDTLSKLILKEAGDIFVKKKFMEGLKGALKIEDVFSFDIFEPTESLSQKHGITTEDASQISQALACKANIFLTRDFKLPHEGKLEGLHIRCPERIQLTKETIINVPQCNRCKRAQA